MIYESVEFGQSIRQGDIFQNIPRLEISLSEIPVIDDEGTRITSWKDLVDNADEEEGVAAVVKLRPVNGIVITQDCDAARGIRSTKSKPQPTPKVVQSQSNFTTGKSSRSLAAQFFVISSGM